MHQSVLKRRWIVSPNALDCAPAAGSRGAKGVEDEGVGTRETNETVDGAVEWIRWVGPAVG